MPSAWCQQFLPDLDPCAGIADAETLPRYNIAPTQNILGVARLSSADRGQWLMLRWGLIPPWADDVSIGNRLINARGETVDEKPSFKKAFAHRRCLVLADGYYEWKKAADGGKQPYLFEPAGGGLLALAGLWEENRKASPSGAPIRSCTIITTAANPIAGRVHQRMPVILDPDQYEPWLDPQFGDPETLKRFLDPAPDELLRATPVSRHVNSPRHDDPACVEAVDVD